MIRVRAEVWESRAVICERYLISPWWLRVTAGTQRSRSAGAPGDGTLVQPGPMWAGRRVRRMRQRSGVSRAPTPPRVTVVGSLNTDISLAVPHLPGPGETVLSAASAVIGGGGKGANQAVAAARLGAAVRMVGCCGDDESGARLRAGLAAEGVDASGVRVVAGAASGVALITVDAAGENSIAVAAGANGLA